MPRDIDPFALSELEREFEFEFELDDDARGAGEFEAQYEALFEGEERAEEYEMGDDREYEYEDGDYGDREYEGGDYGGVAKYAERFYELSEREFESEAEADSAINGLLTEMEREYFFGSLKKAFNKVKRVAGRVSRSPIGGLIKKGLAAAGGSIPAFQALKGMTALMQGDMRGLLGAMAKSGLGAALPGAAPFLPAAMKGLGFEAGVSPEENREAWNNFAQVSREAYENLANNVNERADDPLEASRLANLSFQQALRNAPRAQGQRARGTGARGARRVIHARPGEVIVIRIRAD